MSYINAHSFRVNRGWRACDAEPANANLNIVFMLAGNLDSCGRKLIRGISGHDRQNDRLVVVDAPDNAMLHPKSV